MVLLLIVPAWLLILLLVVALCRGAQLGDRQRRQLSPHAPQASLEPHRVARVSVGTVAPSAREPSREVLDATNRVLV